MSLNVLLCEVLVTRKALEVERVTQKRLEQLWVRLNSGRGSAGRGYSRCKWELPSRRGIGKVPKNELMAKSNWKQGADNNTYIRCLKSIFYSLQYIMSYIIMIDLIYIFTYYVIIYCAMLTFNSLSVKTIVLFMLCAAFKLHICINMSQLHLVKLTFSLGIKGTMWNANENSSAHCKAYFPFNLTLMAWNI